MENMSNNNLRTLKDFVLSDNEDWICTGELKAEAVKWGLQMKDGIEDCNNIKQYEQADKCEAVLGFIIKFFNLTEEDLK